MEKLNVLGVAGSIRRGSYSAQALKVALEHARQYGAEVRLLEIGKMPMYDPGRPAGRPHRHAASATGRGMALCRRALCS